MSVLALLEKGLSEIPCTFDASLRDNLINYLQLLDKWNRVHNLTAVREQEDRVRLHILDCLAVLPLIDRPSNTVADIGSGAGLPGLLWALARPQWQLYLVESNGKKQAFLREAVRRLQLTQVQVIGVRAEKWQPQQVPTLIVSRAVAGINAFLQFSAHLGDENSCWGLMKAHDNEICNQAGFVKSRTCTVEVPLLNAPRLWIEIRRQKEKNKS